MCQISDWLISSQSRIPESKKKMGFKCIFQPAGFASEHQEETTGLGSLRNASSVCTGSPYCQIKSTVRYTGVLQPMENLRAFLLTTNMNKSRIISTGRISQYCFVPQLYIENSKNIWLIFQSSKKSSSVFK